MLLVPKRWCWCRRKSGMCAWARIVILLDIILFDLGKNSGATAFTKFNQTEIDQIVSWYILWSDSRIDDMKSVNDFKIECMIKNVHTAHCTVHTVYTSILNGTIFQFRILICRCVFETNGEWFLRFIKLRWDCVLYTNETNQTQIRLPTDKCSLRLHMCTDGCRHRRRWRRQDGNI